MCNVRLAEPSVSVNHVDNRGTALRYETVCSILSPLSLGRCDKTPQKLGELIGNSFFQDIAIIDTKAIADAH
jgi:hypothetical protein